jgi:hypothetical protein
MTTKTETTRGASALNGGSSQSKNNSATKNPQNQSPMNMTLR